MKQEEKQSVDLSPGSFEVNYWKLTVETEKQNLSRFWTTQKGNAGFKARNHHNKLKISMPRSINNYNTLMSTLG
jgi:hypothetical protein